MLSLIMSNDNFINDIHPLVRSFFPGEEIEVSFFPEDKESGSGNGTFRTRIIRDSALILDLSLADISDTDRLRMKNILKCRVYEELSSVLKVKLPWGTLTGIRPVRLAINHMEQGFTHKDTVEYMESFYLVSPEKSALAADIAVKEMNIIKDVNYPGSFSLYIGIPFCPTTCLYCSFTSNAIGLWKTKVGEYLDCLEMELKFVSELFSGRKPVSIYIGGGTPTTLNEEELKRLFDSVHRLFDFDGIREFTVEAGRPDSITKEKLRILRENGADRISVNPQSMNQETLKIIGRQHSVEDTVRAFQDARDAGFDNINMDIILGLPGEGEKEVSHTISEIAKLKPDDLTVHSLAVKRGSRLMEEIEKYKVYSNSNTDVMLEIAALGAREMGLEPYYLYRQKNMSGNFENTGWARPGKEGIYNILMMEEIHSIPAVGAGTVSKCVHTRTDIRRNGNVKDVNGYISRIDEMLDRKRALFKQF